jgi:hydrogenase/urease accessory protein HupE
LTASGASGGALGSRAGLAAATAVVLVLLSAAPACAHDQPYSWLDLRLSRAGIEGRVTAHIVDLAHEAGIATPDSLLVPAFAARHTAALEAMLAPRLALLADGDTLRPTWTGHEAVPARKGIAFTWRTSWTRMPGTLRVEGPLFPYDPQHETYLNVYESGALRHQDLLDHTRTRYDHYTGSRQGLLAVLHTFLVAGMHHIFIGPDHILFIVGLLLLGGRPLRLLKIVTAFTLAHSVTLALATLGVVNPPARLVEPAIALSIVAVGIGNLRARPGAADGRAWVALGFGFIHGFGFASVLREFGLPREALGASLFAFNAGVEVGQACIVAVVAPVLALTRRRAPAQAPRVVAVGSVIVALAGGYWFVERVFFAPR